MSLQGPNRCLDFGYVISVRTGGVMMIKEHLALLYDGFVKF